MRMTRPMAKITDMVILLAAVMMTLTIHGPPPVAATTNGADVEALHVLYSSLNNPQQLSGWKSKGGDPCGESWKGISCSGSAVISIRIPGLQLKGTLGYLLSNLSSLTILDVSNNHIHDVIPYQLPPNLTYMNFGGNNFSGNLPFSISALISLSYLNASHNSLSQSVGDFFGHLEELSILDLSFNNFSGVLPNSFGSLSKLSSLYLQNNRLSGQVKILSNLTLNKLNIANNNFSGRIPASVSSIPDPRFEGNSFDGVQAPAPAPVPAPTPALAPKHAKSSNSSQTQPPSREFNGTTPNMSGKRYHGSSIVGQIIGIVLGSLFVSLSAALIVILCLRNHARGKHPVKKTSKSSTSSLVLGKDRGDWNQLSDYMSSHAPTEWSYRMKDTLSSNSQSSSPHQNKAPTNEAHEIRVGVSVASPSLESPESRAPYRNRERSALWKKKKVPINVTFYTVATLQSLTNNFSQECLIGEGSHGRVYRADLSNGKALAIKKLESSGRAAAVACEEEKFIEAVCNMSRLRQSSIVPLVGYCVEHGQRLLVHEFIGNGNLHDILHRIADKESGKPFSWNARMKVALGAARALEYLHEVCLPAVVHKNVKSPNILLDEDLNPYLSDCGLASLIPNTPRQEISAQVMDSFGYSAPESAMSGVYTVKSDVYSFGVIMLELLTGRKSLDRWEQSLVWWAAPQLHDIDSLARMVDPALNGVYPARSLSRFADVIALCVQVEPEFRPAMSEVAQSLIRLVQRSSLTKRHSGEEFGFTYKTPERDAPPDPPTY